MVYSFLTFLNRHKEASTTDTSLTELYYYLFLFVYICMSSLEAPGFKCEKSADVDASLMTLKKVEAENTKK